MQEASLVILLLLVHLSYVIPTSCIPMLHLVGPAERILLRLPLRTRSRPAFHMARYFSPTPAICPRKQLLSMGADSKALMAISDLDLELPLSTTSPAVALFSLSPTTSTSKNSFGSGRRCNEATQKMLLLWVARSVNQVTLRRIASGTLSPHGSSTPGTRRRLPPDDPGRATLGLKILSLVASNSLRTNDACIINQWLVLVRDIINVKGSLVANGKAGSGSTQMRTAST